jgi:hypothetical protein
VELVGEWVEGKKVTTLSRKDNVTQHSTLVWESGYVGDVRNRCRDFDACKGQDAL